MAKTVDASSVNWDPVYPWDEWFDGQARILSKGEDFEVEARTMARSVLITAKRRGLRVRTKVDGDTLAIQRVDPR